MSNDKTNTPVTSRSYKPAHSGYPGANHEDKLATAIIAARNDSRHGACSMCAVGDVPNGGLHRGQHKCGYTGTDANHDAIKATTPTTCCPCGQVPVCNGLRTCGKNTA